MTTLLISIIAAEFRLVEGVGHNLMMERSYMETAEGVRDWIGARVG